MITGLEQVVTDLGGRGEAVVVVAVIEVPQAEERGLKWIDCVDGG